MVNDVVIIGNGILGYSVAYALALKAPDLKITIIGANHKNGDATHAAGAMLGCFGEVTKYTFSHPAHIQKFSISLAAAKKWDSWIESISHTAGLRSPLKTSSGTYLILNSVSGQLDCINFDAVISALNKYQEPYYEVGSKDIPGFLPADNARPLKAIYLPNECYIDSSALMQTIYRALCNLKNISFINDDVQRVEVTSGQTHSIVLTDSVISTDKIVIAAGGAGTQRLLNGVDELKGRIQPVFSGFGCALVVENCQAEIKHVIRTPNRSFSCGLHALPRDGNSLYIGATNKVSIFENTSANIGHVNFLLNCAFDQINRDLSNANLISMQVGNRPVSLDTFPLIGETSIPGLYLLSGTYRDGLHQSPILAESISDNILHGKVFLEDIFSPERFPISTFNKEQAISEAMMHYMGGAYEQLLNMPKIGWYDMLEEMMEKKIRAIYDGLDTDFILPPDFLLMLDDNPLNINVIKESYEQLGQNSYASLKEKSSLEIL